MERASMCPQCNAPLAPHHFARSVVCAYCGATVRLDEAAVEAEAFHKSFRIWNSPSAYQISNWISIGENHWELSNRIAQGEIADVYTGRRARWPTELVVVKLLRNQQDAPMLAHEWEILKTLHRSTARGADTFTTLLPQLVMHGTVTDGSHGGTRVNIFRWTSGFLHTFEEVMKAYPQGIPPRASIWVWRRMLEVLSFLHNSGVVHGAVLPAHLLVQENEHGVRLVGYGAAGRAGEKLRALPQRYESFYPKSTRMLTPQLDLVLSARCMAALLGGNSETASLPAAVPPPLAEVIRRVALSDAASAEDAWAIREELGKLAERVFGAPQFIPIVMPS